MEMRKFFVWFLLLFAWATSGDEEEVDGQTPPLPTSPPDVTGITETDDTPTSATDAPGSSNAEEKKYKCSHCPKQYKYKRSRTHHMRIHHKNQLIHCETCDDLCFETKPKYDKHTLSHTGKKLHECPTCNHWFGRLSTLKRHQYIHLEEKTVKCPECPIDNYFQTYHLLSKHMLVQHKGKQHECSTCHKKFHRRGDLKQHQLVHTKVKAFQCGICDKSFSQSGHLENHIGLHLGEKPYKCEICDKGFIQSNNLKIHQKRCASRMEKRSHKCPKCRKRYANKTSLNTHMKSHNNNI